MVERAGKLFLSMTHNTGLFTSYFFETLVACFRPPFEWGEFAKQLERVGVRSSPVVMVTAIFTGMVFTLQTYDGFKRFQAEAFVPGVLGVALLRELVPVLGCMMVAGRVGSAMAAELGTMRVTDQIEALEVMGCDPLQFLVAPRFLAMVLMTPLLIAVGDIVGIWSGWFLITQVLHESSPDFMNQVFNFLDFDDFWSGQLKAAVFGAIIASVGCFKGLYTQGGAEGVGRNTTHAVVYASLGILVADFVLTKALF